VEDVQPQLLLTNMLVFQNWCIFLWFEPKALARGAIMMANPAFEDCSAVAVLFMWQQVACMEASCLLQAKALIAYRQCT
jgi:hypothetical protein